jgi:hypothetical protein
MWFVSQWTGWFTAARLHWNAWKEITGIANSIAAPRQAYHSRHSQSETNSAPFTVLFNFTRTPKEKKASACMCSNNA